MKNNERKQARRYDTAYRCRKFTEKVYSGKTDDREKLIKETYATEKAFYPEKSEYNIYFGELHGHTRMSDGHPTVDEYFTNIRDNAKLDFAALSDHDHGGIGKEELFGEIWEYIKSKVGEYYEPHKFTTILAYERDSYPWYNNMVVYFNNHNAEMLPHSINGEITRRELYNALNRDDVLLVPHDTYSLNSGTDLQNMPTELFTPLIEMYSRGDCTEYFGNPWNTREVQCEGGYFQDAIKRGARMGVIAASDDHRCKNGLICDEFYSGLSRYPGITAVLAKENTLEAVFDALKNRRCYGFMGEGRIYIDFRINGHCMGEEFAESDERKIYFRVDADQSVEKVTLVKNCRDYIIFKRNEQFLFDYKAENDTDSYYLRIELSEGRLAWTSPIWVNKN